MNRLEGITARTAIALLCAFIVIGGFGLALLSGGIQGTNGNTVSVPSLNPTYQVGQSGSPSNQSAVSYSAASAASFGGASASQGWPTDGTEIISESTSMTTTMAQGLEVSRGSSSTPANVSLGTGSQIEFSSDVSISCSAPQKTAARVVALAYTVGGYVAYQSTAKDSAYVVIRVPASDYQSVLTQVEAMGNVTSLVSNSNDVTVQYTDLNATVASLVTEQGALLRLLNQSAAINTTLAIESQLQGVDQQINDAQSQILQTKTLVDFATIDVTLSETAQSVPLSMKLTATPMNGTAPLSVTFNAIVKGGAQPYVVNYNFGDGTADQGQILIHTYYASGDYKVTVTATDQNGTVATASATIRVAAAPSQYGVVNFPTTIANLFVNVVEGIAEVAVVVLPLAAVGALVVIPLMRRSRTQKEVKQSQ
jgi:PKD repeat protein